MTLGVSLIVKDETWQLKRLLESIKNIPFNDRVIVLTSDSKETEDIAKNYKFRTFNFKWVNDYSKARNYSFSKNQAEYICWFDADDEVENQDSFQSVFLMMLKEKATNLRLPYIYKEKNRTPFMTIIRERVVKKNLYRWNGFLHETLDTESDENCFFSDKVNVIHHWKDNDGRYKRNVEISKFAFKSDPSLRHVIAYSLSLADIGMIKEALDLIRNESFLSLHPQYQYCYNIFKGDLYLNLGYFERAIECFDEASRLFPEIGESYFKKAEVAHFKENFLEVVKLCTKGFYLNEPFAWSAPVKHENFRLRPAKLYSFALYKLGHPVPALEVLSETLKSYPDDKWINKFKMELTKDLIIKEVLDVRDKKSIL